MTTITAWSLWGYPISAQFAASAMMLVCILPICPPVVLRRKAPQARHSNREARK